MVDATNNDVNYDILIEARKAIKTLQSISSEADGTAKKIENLANAAVQLGKTMGTSWQEALAALKAVRGELSSTSGVFNSNNSVVEAGAEEYLKATEGAGSFAEKQKEVASSTHNVTKSVEGSNKSLFSFSRILSNLITGIALGIIYKTFQFINETIKKSIALVRDLEISISKLSTAEKSLSEAGVEVSMEDLLQIVNDIGTEFKAFSDADIKQAVANAALLTKEFGFTAEQIRQAARAGAALALRTPGETIEGATEKLLSGLTSGKFVALRNMGVGIDAVSVQTRALADTGKDLVSQLTTQDKAAATLALVYESLADEIENVDKKLDTLDGRMRQNDAAAENLKTNLGTLFAPFIRNVAPFLNVLSMMVDTAKIFAVIFSTVLVTAFTLVDEALKGNIKSLDDYNAALERIMTATSNELLNEFFPDGKPNVMFGGEFFDDFFSGLEKFDDTPTGEVEAFTLALEDMADVDLDDLADDLAKLNERIDDLNSTFERTESRKRDDYLLKRARAEQDYANKIREINQDTASARAEENRKYREKEIQAESKYQDDLRKLREQFLFSLEDALRERDARQVLRLTRKYEMDKNNLSVDYEARRAEEARQHRQNLIEINQRANERLAEAAREQKIKMARMAEDEAIRAKRAKEDHTRELAELREQITRRLEEEAHAIAESLELQESGAEAIYDVLKSYYGQGGAFEGLFSYAAKSQVAQYEAMLARIMSIHAQAAMIASSPLFSKNSNLPSGYIPATGGGSRTLFSKNSNLPSGYLPSSDMDSDTAVPTNAVQSGRGNDAGSGELKIMLDLNPDLEARIINSSLKGVSATIEMVRREK